MTNETVNTIIPKTPFASETEVDMFLKDFAKAMNESADAKPYEDKFCSVSINHALANEVLQKIFRFLVDNGFTYIIEPTSEKPLIQYGKFGVPDGEGENLYYVTFFTNTDWTEDSSRLLMSELSEKDGLRPEISMERRESMKVLKDCMFYHGIDAIKLVIGDTCHMLTGAFSAFMDFAKINPWEEKLFDPDIKCLYTFYVQNGGTDMKMEDRDPWDKKTEGLRTLRNCIVNAIHNKSFIVPMRVDGKFGALYANYEEKTIEIPVEAKNNPDALEAFCQGTFYSTNITLEDGTKVLPVYTDFDAYWENYKDEKNVLPIVIAWMTIAKLGYRKDAVIALNYNEKLNENLFLREDEMEKIDSIFRMDYRGSYIEGNNIRLINRGIGKAEALIYEFLCEDSAARLLELATEDSGFGVNDENLRILRRASMLSKNEWEIDCTLNTIPIRIYVNNNKLCIQYFTSFGTTQRDIEGFIYEAFLA